MLINLIDIVAAFFHNVDQFDQHLLLGDYITAVLSSENIGIEYYQVGIFSATSIVLQAYNPLKLLVAGAEPRTPWRSLRLSPRPPSRLERGQAPSPDPAAPQFSRLQRSTWRLRRLVFIFI